MSDVEERWAKALKETRVSSFGVFWGRVAAVLLVVGVVTWITRVLPVFPGVLAVVGCLFAIIHRRLKEKRREELAELAMEKISNGMETRELVTVLSVLSDLGRSARRALPVIEEIEKANAGSSVIRAACVEARFQIVGGG